MIYNPIKKILYAAAFSLLLMVLASLGSQASLYAQSGSTSQQQKQQDPWTAKQLLAPSDLARSIETGAKDHQPLVLSVGPAAMIKGSIDIGPASEKDHLAKLKAALQKLPRDKEIVIYCGCCPFTHCPNIRPAFTLLKEMQFKNARLLNLEHNIRTDWIDKGYPTEN